MLNHKLNALVSMDDSFSPTNFQNMMITHESTLKTILSESKWLFDAQAKLIEDETTKVQSDLTTSHEALSKVDSIVNEVKELKTSILAANTQHNQDVISSIKTLVSHYDNEINLVDQLTEKELKLRSWKLELKQTKKEFEKV